MSTRKTVPLIAHVDRDLDADFRAAARLDDRPLSNALKVAAAMYIRDVTARHEHEVEDQMTAA